MPLPANVNTATVTGRFLRPDGTAATGHVVFEIPSDIYADGTIVRKSKVHAVLDVDGQFSVQLIGTNDADVSPTGWTYTVVEHIDSHPARAYSMAAPVGAMLDLSEVAPVPPSSGAENYVLQTAFSALDARVVTLEATAPEGIDQLLADVAALDGRVTAVEAYGDDIVALQVSVDDLDTRVTALEAGGGTTGPAGPSAYDVAVTNGFVGTESQWLASLVGPQGTPGTDGSDGAPGTPGADGESAYEIAVVNGFVGTEAQWLASLEGPQGPPGNDGAPGADGQDGTGASADRRYRDKIPDLEMVWGGTSGHPYTTTGGTGATFDLNHTATFALGDRSIKITTGGTGANTFVRKLAGTAIDFTDRIPVVWFRCDDPGNELDIEFWLGSGGALSSAYKWALHDLDANSYYRDGEWVRMTLPWSKANVVGTPDRSALADLNFQVFDDGAVLNVYWGGFAAMPDTSATFPKGVVSLTFDDGFGSTYDIARPYMDKYGYSGTCYPICDAIGTGAYMTTAELRELVELHGWEMGMHSFTGADHNATGGFTSLSDAALAANIKNNWDWLVDNGLDPVRHFAYPQGIFDESTGDVLRPLVASARTTKGNHLETVPPGDRMKLYQRALSSSDTAATITALIDKAVDNGEWLILTFHDIVAASPTGTSTTTAIFQAIIDYCATSGVAVRTVDQVMQADRPEIVPVPQKTVVTEDGSHAGWLLDLFIDYAPGSTAPEPVLVTTSTSGSEQRTFWLSEAGALRTGAPKPSEASQKVYGAVGGSTSHIWELWNWFSGAGRHMLYALNEDGLPEIGLFDGGAQNSSVTGAHTIVLGPSDPVPTGLPAGTVIVRTAT